ncbi:hypothetical protein C4K03_2377 [Pseudomonas synxantha]|uniref:Uncharacterized protein n=1 Tax=Pseudomonas synxantha TaxID=47883 RepID=A0A3G7U770_9PSED|nr:hypothetical protein C4K03_2377 [Pseudomonas synxantha]
MRGVLEPAPGVPLRHAEAVFRRPARQHAQVAAIFKATAPRR